MAKASKRERELADRLHAMGLRRRYARRIAQASEGAGGRLPASVSHRLGDLRATLGEIGVRVGRGGAKRSEAAKKAARTRKRNEAKRSSAARKGAKTRAQKKDRTDAMLKVGKK